MNKTISIQNFNNRIKSIEKKNIKNNKSSLTWVSMLHYFNDCIIETTESTITFDEKKYKEIKNNLLKN